MMVYTVYILNSELNAKLYIGQSQNLSTRLKEHNAGKTKSIKPFIPYKVVYSEEYKTRREAVKREKYLKSGSGREFIKSLLPG